MIEALLSTKIRIPSSLPTMVQRLRLQEQLDAGLTKRFILISAPAGFGKTSLVSQWLADYPGLVAWISLDKGDNDPTKFLRYILLSIQTVAPRVGITASALLNALVNRKIEI